VSNVSESEVWSNVSNVLCAVQMTLLNTHFLIVNLSWNYVTSLFNGSIVYTKLMLAWPRYNAFSIYRHHTAIFLIKRQRICIFFCYMQSSTIMLAKQCKRNKILRNSHPNICYCGRRGGLMVSMLDSGATSPGSSPGLGHCVVFLGKTLYSHCASLHPGV